MVTNKLQSERIQYQLDGDLLSSLHIHSCEQQQQTNIINMYNPLHRIQIKKVRTQIKKVERILVEE